MFKVVLLLVSGAVAFSSCASQVHRGVVAMKIDDSTAHVGLKNSEVSVGDHVELYSNKCPANKFDRNKTCEKVLLGHGAVTEIINENYVAVKFENGIAFHEGEFVEKHSH